MFAVACMPPECPSVLGATGGRETGTGSVPAARSRHAADVLGSQAPIMGCRLPAVCGGLLSVTASRGRCLARPPKWPPGLPQPAPCCCFAGQSPAPPGLGSWQPCPAVAGMEFPAFLVGRMALESYLLCPWHQLVSDHVAVCVRPETSRAAAFSAPSFALPPPTAWHWT